MTELMATTDHERCAELSARIELGEVTELPGTALYGDAAQSAARHAIMEATGAATLQEAMQLALGRPPANSPKHGPSPVIRARVPQVLKDQLSALAEREQRDESSIVREAIAAYIELRQAS